MAHCVGKESKRREGGRKKERKRKPYWGTRYANVIYPQISPTGKPLNERVWPGALSIYEKNPEISVVAKVEFPIGKKLFHLVVNPGTWRGARPWTWNWYKLRET